MTPFPGYKNSKYQANKAPGGGEDPRQASGRWSTLGRIQRPKAWAAGTRLLTQAAERQGPGPRLHSAPIVAGPGGPSREPGAGTSTHLPRRGSGPRRPGQGRVAELSSAPALAVPAAAAAEVKGGSRPGPGAAGWLRLSVSLLLRRRSQPPLAVRARKRPPLGPRARPPGREHAPPTGKFR